MIKRRTCPWTMNELEESIKRLKRNKSRDPHGLVNELFMKGNAGKDLKEAMLCFFNEIKYNMKIPDFINLADITSIYKQKSSKEDMANQRALA